MSKHLIIAGHGKRRNGTFDPGAKGKMKKAEHNYMKDVLFKSMEKYADDNFIFFTAHNVYDYGDLVNLAKRYGADDVTEIHYDASSNASAKGGHIIIWYAFEPDEQDISLRNALASTIGVNSAYKHKGHVGISGRSDLANPRRAAQGGVTYRLVEIGFGTNAHDAEYMTNQHDVLAKELVEAISDSSPKVVKESNTSSKPKSETKQTWKEVAYDIYKGKGNWGNNPIRREKLKKAGYNPDQVQQEINRLYGLKQSSKPKDDWKKVAHDIAFAPNAGGWGNNPTRREKLKKAGYNPDQVQQEINRLLMGNSKQVNVEELARQVYRGFDGMGKRIPNGVKERAKHFGISEREMQLVQNRVNEMYKN